MDANLTKADLEKAFASKEAYGIGPCRGGSHDIFPDGENLDNATAYARYVRRALGARAAIYGFWEEDNPTARISSLTGGHDFAIVDDRYIVDAYVPLHRQLTDGQAVFDLSDASDRKLIDHLYGDVATWERIEVLESRIDAEWGGYRDQVMARTSFAALLPVPEPEIELAPAFGS